ncbi:MAG: outer membrane protein assembly factor BamD [Filomicrobium sp.]
MKHRAKTIPVSCAAKDDQRNSAIATVSGSWLVLLLVVLITGSLVMGCASSNDLSKALNPDPPAKMFADADRYLSKGQFNRAAARFEDLDRDHPYAPEARRAIVMSAYAYYKAGKYPEAIASARRYTTMHPGTKEAALAHHIIASAYFDDMNGPNRDQSSTKKALKELKIIQTRYPDSEYASTAENRIRVAEDTLAAAEMEVGRYYLKRRNYVAAINRFKTVATTYQTTAHVEEALMRLTESYMALGIVNEAQTAAAVLGHNFPQSKWYKDAYSLLASGGLAPREDSGSWLSKAWKSIPKFSLGGPG